MTPHLELQRAIVAALKGDAVVTSLVSDRVYDRVPQRTSFPHIALGQFQILPDDVECINAFEVYVDINVWSRTYGTVECRSICSAIYDVLHEIDLNLSGLAAVEMRLQDIKDFVEPDGETTRGVVTFRALIDKA